MRDLHFHAREWSMLALAFSLLLAGCQRSKTVVPLVEYDPADAAADAMTLYDANKDGKIDGAELDKAPSLRAGLDMLGSDVRKGVAAEQIAARIKKWADDKAGIIPVLCNVTRNGAPLANAEVRFVPDPFLAEYLTAVGVGKTDESGLANISLPRESGSDQPRGIPPGFYRVEITKAGETIPAQYNTATTLGQEISLDGARKHALEGKRMLFDLKF
jgi:hypothetical protein